MKLRASWCVGLIFSLLMAVSASSVMGQTAATGALTGTVTDSTGAVIPNVTVTATSNTGQVRTATTGGDGSYTVGLLPPGDYRVKFEAAGFEAVEVPAVTVTVTETGTLNRQLAVGAQTQEVTVQANVETVQTASSSVGTVVGSKGLTDIPLSTRNYTNLLTLAAGANASVQNATAIGKGSDNVSVNGSSTGQNTFLMDGVSISALGSSNSLTESGTYGSIAIPNPDALQEFKIQTSTYDASYGRNPGASVNVVTKSGTNAFHGTAFEFFRNTVLNANDFFIKSTEYQKSLASGTPFSNTEGVLNQNQYGGVLGGPVKKDKLFFFASYQNTAEKDGLSTFGIENGLNLPPLPAGDRSTAAWKAALGAAICPTGATTQSSQDIANSAAGSKPGTTVGLQVACNGSNINPVALNILNLKFANGNYYIPSSGLASTAANSGYLPTTLTSPATFWEHQANGNFDYVINSKNTLSARNFYSRDSTFAPFSNAGAGVGSTFLLGSAGTLGYLYDDAILKLTTILTSNLVNEARISYQRNATYITPAPSAGETSLFTDSQVGITQIQPDVNILSYMQINGLFILGIQDSSWVYAHSNDFQAADQISWSHGKHTIRAGFEATHEFWHYNLVGFPIGQAVINSFADFLLGLPGCTPGTSAAACAAIPPGTNGTGFSVINSITTTDRTEPGGNIHNLVSHSANAFLQDDFKINKRLTLNLGLRWEYDSVMYDKDGQDTSEWPNLIKTQPVPGSGCVYNGFSWGLGAAGTGCSFAGYEVMANYEVSRLGPLPAGVFQNNTNSIVQNSPPWDNFAPRVGFAWQPLSSNRFVVRGGYGYFYDRVDGGRIGATYPNQPPYVSPLAGSGAALVTQSLANPFPNTPLGWQPRWINPANGASSNYILGGAGGPLSSTYVTPLVYQYGLNIQYEFLPSWVMEVGYVGSQGIHQVLSQPINYALLTSTATSTATSNGPSLRVPYLGFSPTQFLDATNGGFKFNSFQATVRKQLLHGLTMQSAYTWSRAFISSWVGDPHASLTNNIPALIEYGLNPAYHPQRLTFSYAWELPLGHHQGLMDKVASGWVVSGVTTIQGGTPMTITDTRLGSVFGATASNGQYAAGMGVANVENSGSLYQKVVSGILHPGVAGDGYLNSAAFTGTNPASALAGCSACTGTLFGNSGLGTVLGPGQDNWDMSLSKLTKVGGLREDATLQFRAEFFNLFNHPQFNNPALAANSASSFGTITGSSVNPRLIQMALKYSF